MTITAETAAPLAVDDLVYTTHNQPILFDPLANDVNLNGDALSIVSVINTNPFAGHRIITLEEGLHFIPQEDFIGETTFLYRITDGQGFSDHATVTIRVEPEPVASSETAIAPLPEDDYFSVATGEALFLDPAQLLANDAHPEGDDLLVGNVTATSDTNGTVTRYGQQILYTPDVGFAGAAAFIVEVHNGEASAFSHVFINVEDQPTIVETVPREEIIALPEPQTIEAVLTSTIEDVPTEELFFTDETDFSELEPLDLLPEAALDVQIFEDLSAPEPSVSSHHLSAPEVDHNFAADAIILEPEGITSALEADDDLLAIARELPSADAAPVTTLILNHDQVETVSQLARSFSSFKQILSVSDVISDDAEDDNVQALLDQATRALDDEIAEALDDDLTFELPLQTETVGDYSLVGLLGEQTFDSPDAHIAA